MPTSPVVDLSRSFEPVFIGLVLCLALFGLALAQTWMYFWNCWNKDSKALKFFIACIVIMAATQTAVNVYSMYWYMVVNFSNAEALAANKWFITAQANFGNLYVVAIQLLVAFSVSDWLAIVLTQCRYYARQIYLVSRKIYPVIIIVILIIGASAVGFYTMTIQLSGRNIANRFGDVQWLITVLMFENVLVDILITVFMSRALYLKRTGFAKTDSTIKTLMAYTINTGLLTSLLGIALAVTFLISPRTQISVAIYYPMGKCYVNSVLALLNSRDYIRDRASPENSDNSFALTTIRVTPSSDISVIVRRSTASTRTQNKSDPNMEYAF